MAGACEVHIGLHGRAVLVQVNGPVFIDLAGKGVLLVHGGAGMRVDALGLLGPLGGVVYGAASGQGEAGGLVGCGEAGCGPDGLVLRAQRESAPRSHMSPLPNSRRSSSVPGSTILVEAQLDMVSMKVGFGVGAVGYGSRGPGGCRSRYGR